MGKEIEMSELTPQMRLAFFQALHRAVVILDDWLCDTFGFSRKGRGKYEV